jgi:hypothetical protein
MPRYVIEREIPGAGQLSAAELRAISRQSVGVIKELGGALTWLNTFIVNDKMYCIFDSTSEELIYEHARCMGVPASLVSEVRAVISPATAET